MRKTHALVQVALALLEDPHGRHWGYDTARKAGVRSGVLYPMLTRMFEAGWLTDGWEDRATTGGRPARRYYRLTERGLAELGALLVEAQDDPRFAAILVNARRTVSPGALRLKPGFAR
jgi:PadR family transcriptional regulator, regulatory protein PadR